MYKYQAKIRFHHTDAAGVIFFSNLLVLVHDCYESFIEQTKTFASFFEQGQYFVPIVHAEADYLMPIRTSDVLDIEMTLDAAGNSSFAFGYDIKNQNGKTVAKAKTVHVAVDVKTKEKVGLPQEMRDIIEKL